MKLYATITSERATKGQGGKWLKIEVIDEKRKTLGIIDIFPADKNNAYGLICYDWKVGINDGWQVQSHGIIEANDTEAKDERGEKQKGEIRLCKKCSEPLEFNDDIQHGYHNLEE